MGTNWELIKLRWYIFLSGYEVFLDENPVIRSNNADDYNQGELMNYHLFQNKLEHVL